MYRNFPYERTTYAQYQGYMKTEVEQVLTSPYRNRIILVPYNEPDGNWFSGLTTNAATLAAFEAEWLQTYNFIKGLWPQARIAGPNLSGFYPAALGSFLQFCLANHCLPALMTWHELAVASTVRTDVAAYRALETTVGLPHHLPINIDEYAARYQLTSPGQMVAWLSALEAEKVGGDLAYWNINGTLGDSVAQQNIPNAQWWLYNWYSSLSGHTVAVTTPDGNTDDTLQGLATLDTAKRQARIIMGGGPAIATPGRSGFASGVVYVVGKDKSVYAPNLTTGGLIWKYTLQGGGNPTGSSGDVGGAALLGNRLYVPSDKGMYALNAITGTLIWHVLTTSTFYASPAITGPAGRMVLVDADNEGRLWVLNQATGATLWEQKPAYAFWASPAVSQGHIYVAGLDGVLRSFAPAA